MIKTFTFIQLVPPQSTRLKLGTLAKAGQTTAHEKLRMYSLNKSSPKNFPRNPCTPPTPSRLLLPGCSPPLCSPAGLLDGKGWGDLLLPSLQSIQSILSSSTLLRLVPSPPPILHALQSHPSHFIPSVHKNFSTEVFYVDSLCHKFATFI